MNLIRALAGLAIFILGLYAGWILLQGLNSGEIMQMSRHSNAILHKDIEPSRYWIAIGFWTIATLMLISGGATMLRKNL